MSTNQKPPAWTFYNLPPWAERWADIMEREAGPDENRRYRARLEVENWIRMTQPSDLFEAWRECPSVRLMTPLLEHCDNQVLMEPLLRVFNEHFAAFHGNDLGRIDPEGARARNLPSPALAALIRSTTETFRQAFGMTLRMPQFSTLGIVALEGVELSADADMQALDKLVGATIDACERTAHLQLGGWTAANLVRRAFPLPPPEVQLLLGDGEPMPEKEG